MSPSPLHYRLKRAGWTEERAINEPEERWPVPSPPYPPNRHYHFLNNRTIAVIVDDERNEIIGSLPGGEAWEAIMQHGPNLLDASMEQKEIVIKNQGHGGWVLNTVDLSAPWTVQILVTKEGTWTVHRTRTNKGVVLLNREVVAMYDTPADLEGDAYDEIPDAVLEAAWLIYNQQHEK